MFENVLLCKLMNELILGSFFSLEIKISFDFHFLKCPFYKTGDS